VSQNSWFGSVDGVGALSDSVSHAVSVSNIRKKSMVDFIVRIEMMNGITLFQ